MGPEEGATLPGMTVVCGDSHTSTHGACAALAFGVLILGFYGQGYDAAAFIYAAF